MAKLDRAKARALAYIEELRQTSEVRQYFTDIVIGLNGPLVGYFSHDSEVKKRLIAATKLKATPAAALHRGLFVQANSVFEAYVRDLSTIVIENRAANVDKYSDLPDTFRGQHIHYSGLILQHMKTGTLAGQKFDFESLTAALGQCFTDASPFSIMPEVFTLLMGNVTSERLESLFGKIDLPDPFNVGVGGCSSIKQVFAERRNVVASRLARETLDNIVSKRNTIVHGDLSTTVEQSDLDEAIDFLEAMIKAIDELARPCLI